MNTNTKIPTLLAAAIVATFSVGTTLFAASAAMPDPVALRKAVADDISNRSQKIYQMIGFDLMPSYEDSTSTSGSGIQRQIRYTANATATLMEPLYQQVDTASFVQDSLNLDSSVAQKAAQNYCLVKLTASAGSPLNFDAVVSAQQNPSQDGWKISVVSLTPRPPVPHGAPLSAIKSKIPAGITVADVSSDAGAAAFRQTLARSIPTASYAARSSDAITTVTHATASDNQDQINRRLGEHVKRLVPGSLYIGEATLPSQGRSAIVSLEIVTLDIAAGKLTGLLRADSSWLDSRTVFGQCSYDTSSDHFSLTLSITPGAQIAGTSGLVVDEGGAYTINTALMDDDIIGNRDNWTYKFTRVADAQRKTIVTNLIARAHTTPADAAPQTLAVANTLNATAPVSTVPDRVLSMERAVAASPGAHEESQDIGQTNNVASAPVQETVYASTAPAVATTTTTVVNTQTRVTSPKAPETSRTVQTAAVERPVTLAPVKIGDVIVPDSNVPAGSGAYIWTNGSWQLLPRNNGRVVYPAVAKYYAGGSPVQPGDQLDSQAYRGSASAGLNPRYPMEQMDSRAVPKLYYDGVQKLQPVEGDNVIIAFRVKIRKNFGLIDGRYPLEVGALAVNPRNGSREINLEGTGIKASGFGERGEPLTVAKAADDLYFVSVQRPLATGRYAFSADNYPYEFIIASR